MYMYSSLSRTHDTQLGILGLAPIIINNPCCNVYVVALTSMSQLLELRTDLNLGVLSLLQILQSYYKKVASCFYL